MAGVTLCRTSWLTIYLLLLSILFPFSKPEFVADAVIDNLANRLLDIEKSISDKKDQTMVTGHIRENEWTAMLIINKPGAGDQLFAIPKKSIISIELLQRNTFIEGLAYSCIITTSSNHWTVEVLKNTIYNGKQVHWPTWLKYATSSEVTTYIYMK